MRPPEQRGREFRLIADYFGDLDRGAAVALGNGDDAAILDLPADEQLVVSSDAASEGVHFPAASDPGQAAYRAVAAAASDLAAMGARPLALTLNLSLPDADDAVAGRVRQGLREAVDDFSLPLVGGDLIRGPLYFGAQVLGAVPRGTALARAGARPGDRVCVSGTLGDAAAGLALVQGHLGAAEPAARYLRERFWRPRPALALGQALRGCASAAIDVSDGLLADAGHLARAGGVALRIAGDALPLSDALLRTVGRDEARRLALAGGEDYVLCFTLPVAAALPAGCFVVGAVEAGAGVRCDVEVGADGYQHF